MCSGKGMSMSTIGFIFPFGIIDFSKVEPLKQSDIELMENEFQ